MMDFPRPSYDQTIKAIAGCDIARENIRIIYEDELRSDEITITDLGVATDMKLRCLKAAVHPSYILTITNNTQHAAFSEFSQREDRPKQQAEAREWVRSKGLLNRLPMFDQKQGVEMFARALERGCGIADGSALMARGESSLTVRPDFLLGNKFQTSSNALICLMQMFSASDASEHGILLIFNGNQAFRDTEQN